MSTGCNASHARRRHLGIGMDFIDMIGDRVTMVTDPSCLCRPNGVPMKGRSVFWGQKRAGVGGRMPRAGASSAGRTQRRMSFCSTTRVKKTSCSRPKNSRNALRNRRRSSQIWGHVCNSTFQTALSIQPRQMAVDMCHTGSNGICRRSAQGCQDRHPTCSPTQDPKQY